MIKPVTKVAPVAAADLAADRVAAQKRRSYADKTVGKVATDEHTFDEESGGM